MQSPGTPPARLGSVRPAIGWIAAVACFFLAVVLGLHWGMKIPIGHLTRDPAAITAEPFYLGFLSHVGILLWFATATLCLFSGFVSSGRPGGNVFRSFLLASGWLTLVLAVDDLFLLHEEVLPHYLGVPEALALGAYAVFVVFYLIRFRVIILRTDHLLLAAAFSFFGLSLMLDILPLLLFGPEAAVEDAPGYVVDYYFLFEDGAKFVGIVSWLVYFTRICADALQDEGERRVREV